MDGTQTALELSPVRKWIVDELNGLFRANGSIIRSDLHGSVFTAWTGASQSSLGATWAVERQDLVNGKMRAVTTTCNAFVGVVVAKVRRAGGQAVRSFSSFDLPKAGGAAWHWSSEGGLPKAGDLYQIGTRGGMYRHVGIVIEVDGITWTTAESGQGGPSVGYDAIKKKGPRVIDTGLMGWINVDEFFADWKG